MKGGIMLRLENIKKNYTMKESVVPALKGISLCFRKSEFVSILGPSGCGKTTLLNILGGLDHYTSGDLIIDGKSTKEFNDHDWDVYRNHRIGFIFQSYNLIPHENILENVELALTIAGISKEEREELLEKDKNKLLEFEQELREKYNPDNIFKNKNNSTERIQDNISTETAIVEYKEKNFIQKLFDKIKHLFRRNN